MRDRVLELRALDRSVEEIAAELTLAGTPVSAQTVWTILDAEGIERLARRAPSARGSAPRLAAIKARALSDWPAGTSIGCDHAGLFLLVPAIAQLGPLRTRRVVWLPIHVGPLGLALTRLAAVAQVRSDPARQPRARAG